MRSWHDCPPEEAEGDSEASNAYLARLWEQERERKALTAALRELHDAVRADSLPVSMRTLRAMAVARDAMGETKKAVGQ